MQIPGEEETMNGGSVIVGAQRAVPKDMSLRIRRTKHNHLFGDCFAQNARNDSRLWLLSQSVIQLTVTVH